MICVTSFPALAFFSVTVRLAAVQVEERWIEKEAAALFALFAAHSPTFHWLYAVLFTGLLEEKVGWEEGRGGEDKLRQGGNLCPLGHCKAIIHPFTPLRITVM